MVNLVIPLEPHDVKIDSLRGGIMFSGWHDFRQSSFTVAIEALAALDPACRDAPDRWPQVLLDHQQPIVSAARAAFERCRAMPGHYLLTADDVGRAAA